VLISTVTGKAHGCDSDTVKLAHEDIAIATIHYDSFQFLCDESIIARDLFRGAIGVYAIQSVPVKRVRPCHVERAVVKIVARGVAFPKDDDASWVPARLDNFGCGLTTRLCQRLLEQRFRIFG
jgi:hypothetical protein